MFHCNSAGALLAGRGQYRTRTRTVKNGTRMRYGSAVGLLISSCRADGRDTARTRTRTRGAVLGQRGRGRAEAGGDLYPLAEVG